MRRENHEKFDNEQFETLVKNFMKKIKPGLEEGKKLYEDGIMNLDEKDILLLLNGSEISNCLIVLITLIIQAYPENVIEYDEDEDFEWVKIFEFLLGMAGNQKQGLVICETLGNKLKINEEMKLIITEKGMNLKNQILSSLKTYGDHNENF